MSLQNILKLFYATLTILSALYFFPMKNVAIVELAQWLWPLSWLHFLSLEAQTIFCAVLSIGLVILCTLSFYKPFNTPLKLAVSLTLFLAIAMQSSFGKIDHHFYTTLFATIPLAFVNANQSKNAYWFSLAQGVVLMTYFLTGVWKLRFLVEYFAAGEGIMPNPLLVNMSWNFVESFQRAPQTSVYEQYALASLGLWIAVALFETLCPLCLLRPQWQKYVGILIIVFHVTVAYAMGIYYLPAMTTAFILFCLGKSQKLKA